MDDELVRMWDTDPSGMDLYELCASLHDRNLHGRVIFECKRRAAWKPLMTYVPHVPANKLNENKTLRFVYMVARAVPDFRADEHVLENVAPNMVSINEIVKSRLGSLPFRPIVTVPFPRVPWYTTLFYFHDAHLVPDLEYLYRLSLNLDTIEIDENYLENFHLMGTEMQIVYSYVSGMEPVIKDVLGDLIMFELALRLLHKAVSAAANTFPNVKGSIVGRFSDYTFGSDRLRVHYWTNVKVPAYVLNFGFRELLGDLVRMSDETVVSSAVTVLNAPVSGAKDYYLKYVYPYEIHRRELENSLCAHMRRSNVSRFVNWPLEYDHVRETFLWSGYVAMWYHLAVCHAPYSDSSLEAQLAYYARLVDTNQELGSMVVFVRKFISIPRAEKRALLERWRDLFESIMDEPTGVYVNDALALTSVPNSKPPVTMRFVLNLMGFDYYSGEFVDRTFGVDELHEIFDVRTRPVEVFEALPVWSGGDAREAEIVPTAKPAPLLPYGRTRE